jgi:hypothetical protein
VPIFRSIRRTVVSLTGEDDRNAESQASGRLDTSPHLLKGQELQMLHKDDVDGRRSKQGGT